MKKIKLFLAAMALTTLGLTACQNNADLPVDYSKNNKAVISVELDLESYTAEIGESFQIKPLITYKDDNEVEVFKMWKSSNTRVATVDDEGLVTTKAGGVANISFIAGNKMASCRVVVKTGDEPEPTPVDPDVPVTPTEGEITLNRYSVTLQVGEEFDLVATTELPGVVLFSIVDTTVASISDNGHITALAEGTTNAVVTVGDKSVNCVVKVLSEQGGGSEEEDEDKSCTVYFFIDFNNADDTDTTETKLLKKFKWYTDRPLDKTQVPANPTVSLDPAFPYFIGWSSHSIIDSKADLWNMDSDVTGNRNYIYLYGIWADVPAEAFVK